MDTSSMAPRASFRLASLASLALALPAALAAAPARADGAATATVPVNPVGPPQSLTNPTAAEPSKGWLFDLRPVGSDVGKTLADHGVYLIGRYLGQGFGEVSGGRTKGSLYEGFATGGVDLDMARIAGIPGATVHAILSDLQGPSWVGYSGSFFANNRVSSFPDGLRVNEFSWDQELFNRRVRILAGRLTPATDFDVSQTYCQFMTVICASPSSFGFDKGAPSYLDSAWGAVLLVKPTAPTYIKTAIYEDEPILSLSNHLGFPGSDWGLNRDNGATIPLEAGYQTTLRTSRYPSRFDAGVFYDTGFYSDPLYNTKGGSLVLNGGTARQDHERSGVYVQAQQTIYRPDFRNDRGLTLFGGGNWESSGDPLVDRAFFAGIWWKGPFAARPNDVFGIDAIVIGLNHRLVERVDQLITKTHGEGAISSNEGSFEANYAFNVAPGINIEPFAQYVSHPDQYTIPNPTGALKHSLFAGVSLLINAADALGLPHLTRTSY
jgi:porin